MQIHRALAVARMFLMALAITPLFVGSARAQGAADSAYIGKFTLTQQIHWGKSVLRPGHYTMAIASSGSPVIVKVQNEDTGEAFRVATNVYREKKTGMNALLLQAKNGQPTVQSVSLPEIGMTLIYEPGAKREPVLEARASQTVPVLLAKK